MHTHVCKTHTFSLTQRHVQKKRGRSSSLLTRPRKQASSPRLPPLEKEAVVFLGNPGSSTLGRMEGQKDGRTKDEEETSGGGGETRRGEGAGVLHCDGVRNTNQDEK